MSTVFDFLSVTLFIAAAAMFFLRFKHEDPPLTPYAVICFVCAAGNWLGNNGGGIWAVAMLMAASFLLLHLASLPYPEEELDAEGSL
ncbi:MAG: XrtV sorting system accessory protein [Pseudomonadota bacterium]